MEKKLGSLFDGIGGFPLAAKRNGIRPIWASGIAYFLEKQEEEDVHISG